MPRACGGTSRNSLNSAARRKKKAEERSKRFVTRGWSPCSLGVYTGAYIPIHKYLKRGRPFFNNRGATRAHTDIYTRMHLALRMNNHSLSSLGPKCGKTRGESPLELRKVRLEFLFAVQGGECTSLCLPSILRSSSLFDLTLTLSVPLQERASREFCCSRVRLSNVDGFFQVHALHRFHLG